MVELISNSRLQTYQACPRLHHFQYRLGIRPLAKSRPLTWGDLMHHGYEEWLKCYRDGRVDTSLFSALEAISSYDDSDEIETARARIIMVGYDARWADDMRAWDVAEVEREFRYPSGRGYDICGKIDGILRNRATRAFWNLEHKNTGSDFSPASNYWRKLRMEPQASQYHNGSRHLGYDIAGTVWDVVKRPDQKPLLATPEEEREYCKTGPRKGQLHKRQRAEDETLQEFTSRLASVISADPDAWYARKEVVRLPDEMAAHDADVRAWADRCVTDTDSPRATGACHRFGAPCAYLPVCDGTGSLDDATKFERVENVHPELTEVTR